MRKITSSIAAIGLVGSLNAYALGIGDITTHSALNQLLNAKISVSSSKEDDPKNLYVKLASSDVFNKAGIEKPAFLLDLKFEPVINKNGQISINVSSETPIKEPFVNFILEVEWPKGRTLKEYTILLDPPISMQDIQPTPVNTTPLKKAKPLPVLATAQTTVREKTSPKTLAAPALQKKKYGPIKSNDTIWAIAKSLSAQEPKASHEQIMIALYNNNPNAFYKKNVSALKRGAILRIPSTSEINAYTSKEAKAEFAKQNRSWASAKTLQLKTAAKTQTGTNKAVDNTATTDSRSVNDKPTASEPTKAKLTLLTPDKTDITKPSTGKAVGLPADNSVDKNNANLAIEMAINSRQEREELESRLTDMEAQLEKLQRLLLLKDKQFAQLQAAQKSRSIEKVDKIEKAVKPEQVEKIEKSDNSNNYLFYAGGALLIGLLALFLARRKKEEAEDNSFTNLDDVNDFTDETDDTDQPVSIDEESSEKPVYETEQTDPEESTLFSEFTPSEFSDSANSSEADPLTECDVYIAYGRFQQAEDLIQKAVDKTPDNPLYLLKLLEVYFASGNIQQFEELSNNLSYFEESEPELWEKVVQMGEELQPNPQFSSPTDIEQDELDELTQTDEIAKNTAKDEKEDDFSFDFDLIDTKTSGSDSAEEIEFDLDSLDLGSDTENSIDTKLSLAEAYIDMEDYSSAKEALNEVLETGSAEQIEKAKQLLDSLAG